MGCRHNFKDPRLTKYGGPKENTHCAACEEIAALKARVEELDTQLKALKSSFEGLKFKFEMSKPLILR